MHGAIERLGDLPDSQGDIFPSSRLADFEKAGANIIVLYYTLLGAAALGVNKALAELKRSHEVQSLGDLVESQPSFESRMGYDQYAARVVKYREV